MNSYLTDEMTSHTATPEPPSITVTTRIRYWPDRLRLALSILRGNQFSLKYYVGDIAVNGATMNGANGCTELLAGTHTGARK